MSTEQQQPETLTADITQQVTSPEPKTRPKNPKQVEAGKLVAERTTKAREAQKEAAAEAAVIIENNKVEAQKKTVAEAAVIIENNKAKPLQEAPAAPSPATE